MKKIIFIYLFLSVGLVAKAQSWSDFFTKENVAKVASVAGVDIPLNIEGEWSYTGSAVQLETDDIFKRAAAEVAAIAVEEKINEQQQKYGIKPGMIRLRFNNGKLVVSALKYSVPASYQLSSDRKQLNINLNNIIHIDATVEQTLDNSLSILFDADKAVELIKYFNKQVDNTSLNTITQVLESYDGLKVGVELEKID